MNISEERPKVMVNKCVVTNCAAGYKTGQKKSRFISMKIKN